MLDHVLSGERVGLMTWWFCFRSLDEANFLSGVFSLLTSAEACEKSNRWLWKETKLMLDHILTSHKYYWTIRKPRFPSCVFKRNFRGLWHSPGEEWGIFVKFWLRIFFFKFTLIQRCIWYSLFTRSIT